MSIIDIIIPTRYRILIYFLITSVILTGCASPNIPLAVETTPETVIKEVTRVIKVFSTPEKVEVTRVKYIDRLVEVTTTPTPGLADDCFKTAQTQSQLNNCASKRYELAMEQLETTLSTVLERLSPEEQRKLKQIQVEWKKQMERDCEFIYGQISQSADGNIIYQRGSAAPLFETSCKASRSEDRNKELYYAYIQE